MTRKHEQLLFVRVTAYNATFNYTIYNAERSQYNFTLITKILTDPKTGEYVTGMNIVPDDKNKAVPVGDTVLVLGNLTLSDYYWTLNKVLMKLRRGDETNWIWGRSAYELRHLSHLMRLKLPEYNQQKAGGLAVVMDTNILWCTIYCALCGAVINAILGCIAITGGTGVIFCVATVLGISTSTVYLQLGAAAGIAYFCLYCCCCFGVPACCDALP